MIQLAPLAFAALLTIVACRQGTGPGSNPVPPTGTVSSPQQPPQRPAQGPLAGNGTFTSGGGNGINGRAVETYQVNIESLPEYKHHILPILRRMSQGRPDVFIAYLNWASRQKAWYFVPVELERLPQDRIHLAFQSDQLALHSETEIFIHEPAYRARSSKDRAALLLHELVMAAKLLMKKSAKTQCEALSKGADLEICRDPAQLKTAVDAANSDKSHQLDGVDHAAVRTMTSFLRDESRSLGASHLFAMRTQLGFRFPWDATLSNLNAEDLRLAIERSMKANDLFDRLDAGGKPTAGRCYLTFYRWPQFFRLFLYSVNPAPPPHLGSIVDDTAPSTRHGEYSKAGTFAHNRMFAFTNFTTDETITGLGSVESFGTLEPALSERTLDQIQVRPQFYGDFENSRYSIFDFFISRGSEPRLVGFRATIVKPLLKTPQAQTDGDMEWVETKGEAPVFCRLKN